MKTMLRLAKWDWKYYLLCLAVPYIISFLILFINVILGGLGSLQLPYQLINLLGRYFILGGMVMTYNSATGRMLLNSSCKATHIVGSKILSVLSLTVCFMLLDTAYFSLMSPDEFPVNDVLCCGPLLNRILGILPYLLCSLSLGLMYLLSAITPYLKKRRIMGFIVYGFILVTTLFRFIFPYMTITMIYIDENGVYNRSEGIGYMYYEYYSYNLLEIFIFIAAIILVTALTIFLLNKYYQDD